MYDTKIDLATMYIVAKSILAGWHFVLYCGTAFT